jgi:uroporphyrinogen-III synthase
MRLILTRPAADAAALKSKLEARGHHATVVPLLKIVPRSGVDIPEVDYQAVCATSANSLRCFPDTPSIRDIPMFTVGKQSLAAATDRGFTRASAHGGDVQGLAAQVAQSLKPDHGPILYLSGAEVSGDLKGELERHGFEVVKVVVYDAIPQAPAGFDAILARHDGVLLYSPRTALIFAELAGKAGVQLDCFCLSAKVAKALPMKWRKHVAEMPDEDSLLALLDREAARH